MKYIITAGGTGGHLYPALTLAKKLKSDNDNVIFIASNRAIDKEIIKSSNVDFDVKYYKMNGLIRGFSLVSILKNFLNVFYTLTVFVKTVFLIVTYRPDVVVGFGGFISYPVVKICNIFKIKSFIHEQNSYPGLVNRKLAPIVDGVFYTYNLSCQYFSNANKLIYSSNPRGMLASTYVTNQKSDYILLVGGSLGAEKINEVALDLAKTTSEKYILICGQRYFEESKIKDIPSNLTLMSYSNDLVKLIADSKLVITRGGATTLIECICAGTLTIVIPSPNVVEDHQTKNASELRDLGLLEYISEEEVSADMIMKKIDNMMDNKQKYLSNMLNYIKVDSLEIMVNEMRKNEKQSK